MLRNAPHTLDLRILNKLFNGVNVRSVFQHFYRNKLKTHLLAYAEVAVIPRNNAYPLQRTFLPAPGLTAADAKAFGTYHHIVHQVEAGVTSDTDIIGRNTHDLREKLLCGRDTVNDTVASGVGCSVKKIILFDADLQHIH